MEKWVVAAKRADFNAIGTKFDIDPVIARLIRNRDIVGEEDIRLYLQGDLSMLPSPWLLKDMEKAVGILEEKIKSKKKIRIIGDYDIDGVSSTYILLKGFRRLQAVIDTYIPDRISDGYGIHEPLILKAKEDGVDTILTCDNGIAARSEIAMAKDFGMTVVVTDHHEIPYRDTENGREILLPSADAVVNPKQPSCTYPNKNICGAVVAWKLIGALYERFRIPVEEFYDLLEFAAIATVGDVMDLQGENRIIVKEGLKKIPKTQNTGLMALIRANGLEGGKITAYHIGFVLGPCINASGRLDTAARSLALFDEEDPDRAAKIAGDLASLNESRKALTEKGKEEAIRQVEETSVGADRVLVIYLPECHESLAGIIAGRIREKYYKPVIVLTKGEHGVKGSGRSIEAYSMFDELVKCADLLEQFGGHPMAAGLSLAEDRVEELRRRLNENCTLTPDDLCQKIVIDVAMPFSYISNNLIQQISLLEPFGKGNTKPVFAQKEIRVLEPRIFGKNRNVAKMRLVDQGGYSVDGVYFGEAEKFLEFAAHADAISVTYYPEINRYQGRESIQIVIQNYR
ncbi:MAG TPA: single-stranded-DNA-specific exonuclease RecJ [Candidatus Blautia faecavium]|uniref:Single-stranded-DNA-specific exonuclease RecJ n=1 Tax=Candidatus Blautia faecavium TaxID=2838487 RepID=A0A9D2RW90_9FIRM|nr:single-stranded-DNA-specific exonuclease RecJ [Candidatus Blautia faecavium]